MNKQVLIQNFKQHGRKRKQLKLKNGLHVVGTFVDPSNMLWYYIDNNGDILLEPASDHIAIEAYPENTTGKVTIPNT